MRSGRHLRGPVDRGARDPSCNPPVCHGWGVGYGSRGLARDGGKSAPIAALAFVAACAGAFVGTRIPSRAPVTHWRLSESAAALPVADRAAAETMKRVHIVSSSARSLRKNAPKQRPGVKPKHTCTIEQVRD